jgi:aminopeptidase N
MTYLHSAQPTKTYLTAYAPPAYNISHVHLDIQVHSHQDISVKSTMTVCPAVGVSPQSLVLDGDGAFLNLKSVKINQVQQFNYAKSDTMIDLGILSSECIIEIVTQFNPSQNHALEGIYSSGGILCSQNEPQGFRRITYFLDRPDVMSCYSVKITANSTQFPVLLSNGNLVSQTVLNNQWVSVCWEDPFPKPSYLFAFVAGDLEKVTDVFVTKSNRRITLEIYVDHGNAAYTQFAMDALKKSMKWDEDRYLREYDLDLYMIVAVDAFNMGAMENKGLNIFNTQYVLGDAKTATDSDIQGIERVIAHEYFHNWTGNRITLRDWFQLTLKEGLTVFRDQQFTEELHHSGIKRIHDVSLLRNYQFVEDSGPMAHPIRPESFFEINNFYTVTVYEKGAEIIRLYHTLLGENRFYAGMSDYFNRFDGQAITTEDFCSAMQSACEHDLSQMANWYSQSGTPTVTIDTSYSNGMLCITATQTGQLKPVMIPIRVALLSSNGSVISFALTPDANHYVDETVLNLSTETCVWTLYLSAHSPQDDPPILSSFRGFSAPVYINDDLSRTQKAIIFRHDTDYFNRWDAGQSLYRSWIYDCLNSLTHTHPMPRRPEIHQIISAILDQFQRDPAFTALLIGMPGTSILLEGLNSYDVAGLIQAKEMVLNQCVRHHESQLLDIYTQLYEARTDANTQGAMNKRSLQNICLRYLCELNESTYQQLAFNQFRTAVTMTDQMAALDSLCTHHCELGMTALQQFFDQWKDYPLLMNKWLAVQVKTQTQPALSIVTELEQHPIFDAQNPNKIRALYGTFVSNLKWFHHESGDGYQFIAKKIIEIDQFNPSMASRLSNAYKKYGALPSSLKAKMKAALTHILDSKELSKNTFEIISRTIESC